MGIEKEKTGGENEKKYLQKLLLRTNEWIDLVAQSIVPFAESTLLLLHILV